MRSLHGGSGYGYKDVPAQELTVEDPAPAKPAASTSCTRWAMSRIGAVPGMRSEICTGSGMITSIVASLEWAILRPQHMRPARTARVTHRHGREQQHTRFVEDRKAISANIGYDACQQPSSCVLSSGHLHHPSDKHPDHSAAMLSKQHVQVWASRPCVSRTSSDKFGKLAMCLRFEKCPWRDDDSSGKVKSA